jgi:K+-transporting ATPase A subunit
VTNVRVSGLIGVVLMLGGLTCLPPLVLEAIAEHFSL